MNLPVELAADIIRRCVYGHDIRPQVLASINRPLRVVTLSLSDLWTDVTHYDPKDLPEVENYLRRSANRSFDFDMDICFPIYPTSAFSELDTLLHPHLHRMKSLRITPQIAFHPSAPADLQVVSTEKVKPFRTKSLIIKPFRMLRLLDARLAALEELEFHLPGVNHYLEQGDFGPSMSMPSLTRLSIHCKISMPLAAQWSTLQYLKCDIQLQKYRFYPELEFLGSFPALTELELVMGRPTATYPEAVAWAGSIEIPISIPSLKTFSLHSPSLVCLALFHFPSLATLSVLGGKEEAFLWRFLCDHSATVESVDVESELGDTQWNAAVPNEAAPYPHEFPCLLKLKWAAWNTPAAVISMRARLLRQVSLRILSGTSTAALVSFFSAVSETLEHATIGGYNATYNVAWKPVWEYTAPQLSFPRLHTFVSQCSLGDIVVGAMSEAPALERLVLWEVKPKVRLQAYRSCLAEV